MNQDLAILSRTTYLGSRQTELDEQEKLETRKQRRLELNSIVRRAADLQTRCHEGEQELQILTNIVCQYNGPDFYKSFVENFCKQPTNAAFIQQLTQTGITADFYNRHSKAILEVATIELVGKRKKDLADFCAAHAKDLAEAEKISQQYDHTNPPPAPPFPSFNQEL